MSASLQSVGLKPFMAEGLSLALDLGRILAAPAAALFAESHCASAAPAAQRSCPAPGCPTEAAILALALAALLGIAVCLAFCVGFACGLGCCGLTARQLPARSSAQGVGVERLAGYKLRLE